MRSGNSKLIRSFILLVFLVITPLTSSEFNFSGYYKSFFTLLIPKDIVSEGDYEEIPDLGMYSGKIRLKMLYSPAEWISFRAEYELTPTILDTVALGSFQMLTGVNPPGYRITDIPDKLYPGGNDPAGGFYINQNLDRFFTTLSFNFADIYIGRQVISWGSSYVFNPTDIISPFNFNEIDKEEKRGVDALRVRIPLGTMDELDIGYVFGDDPGIENSAFFIRSKFNLFKSDFSLLLLGFRQNLLLGFDLSGSLGGAGLRLETAYILDKVMDKDLPEELKNNYFRLSLGLDYNFNDSIYGYFEYHFNSPGSLDTDYYLSLYTENAYSEGSVYLLGKHYISAGITYQLHPLIPFSAFAIYNMSDKSIIISPSLEYNISENIYLSFGAFLSAGKGAQFSNIDSLNLKSEFGSYPNLIFTSFRIYF
ncbi:MAG: hypothetical protein KAS97_03055 [Candidatus Aminicenantes bacterium]|nr:hypothetical protein [Candidatus Aminicenantes bacterium]